MERRKFIKTTTAGSIGLVAAPTILANSNWKGANDRVNVAIIGHGPFTGIPATGRS